MKEEILIDIARDAILEKLEGSKIIDKERLLRENPWLGENGAVFVTLNKNSNLRGCIGSLTAYQPILDDVIKNAKSSAFKDPRFPPLSREELDDIDIEISILTPAEEVVYSSISELKSKIRPYIDGVILTMGYNQATYLPSVWEELPTFELFFESLCQKAQLTKGCLRAHPFIYKYQVKKVTKKVVDAK